MYMKAWATALQDTLTTTAANVLSFLPSLVSALLLLAAGYLLGRLAAVITRRLLELIGIDRLIARTPIRTLLERSGVKRSVAHIVGTIAFWIVFLLFLISAAEVMDLLLLSGALISLAEYIPHLGMAVLIVVLGLAAAAFLRELIALTCSSAGIAQGTIVAQTFYVAAVLLIVVTAINQLGIDTMLLNNTILIIVVGFIAGATIAFGFGARPAMTNVIAAHYLRSVLHVGQHIRVGDVQGMIVALTPISVVLETEGGRAIIPASRLMESETLILSQESDHAAA